MEKRRKEAEFDFDMLLGELPYAGYLNPGYEESLSSAFAQLEFDTNVFNEAATNSPYMSYNSTPNHNAYNHFHPSENNNSDNFHYNHGPQGFEISSTVSNHILRRHIEEEHYYRMQQHYLYMQQLSNQRLDPLHSNGNSSKLMNHQSSRQFRFDQFNHQEPRSNDFDWPMGPMGFNRYNPTAISSRTGGYTPMQNKPHGLNSFRDDVKFGSFGGNKPVHQHRNDFMNTHFRSKNDGYVHFDDVKSTSPTKLYRPQRYNNSISDYSGEFYLMAKDQHGCRLLQRRISEKDRKEIDKILVEIIDHIVELMTDPFGNYLIQKLLEVCDEDQRTQIIAVITRKNVDLIRISCDMHGTRAVQKVVETLTTPKQVEMIVSSLKHGIVTLIKNMNGNHVAQRCLQHLAPEHREFLFEAAANHCVELASDRHGCCVLQKCLNHSDDNQRERLAYKIASNALTLAQDQFGNYVVQCVLGLKMTWAKIEILNQLKGNYWDLSVQKYSSNVVEQCLKYADDNGRLLIVQELMNNPRLDQIMQDPFGNYVYQAALSYTKGELHDALQAAIAPHAHVLRTSPYGKKVLSKNKLKK